MLQQILSLGTARAIGKVPMKNTTMKNTLNILMLVIGAGSAFAVFAGLIGIIPLSAFPSGEVAFSLYLAAGMALIGLNDNGCRVSARRHA